MEKMGRIAKNLDNILNAVYTAFRIAVCVLLVCMVLLPIAGESMIATDGVTSIELGCVSLELAEEAVPASSQIWRLELGMLYVVLVLILGCYLVKLACRMVKPMAEKKPFGGMVSAELRKLSFAALIGGAALSVAQMAGEIALSSVYGFDTLFLNESIVGVKLEYALDMNFIWVFAVLYLLSFVFHYGEELQKQSDETL